MDGCKLNQIYSYIFLEITCLASRGSVCISFKLIMPSFLFLELYREYLSETGCKLVLWVAQTDLELIALFEFIPAIPSTPTPFGSGVEQRLLHNCRIITGEQLHNESDWFYGKWSSKEITASDLIYESVRVDCEKSNTIFRKSLI